MGRDKNAAKFLLPWGIMFSIFVFLASGHQCVADAGGRNYSFVTPVAASMPAGRVKPQPPGTIKMRTTGYCACARCCGKWARHRTTASGHKIKRGDKFAAADRKFAFGSKVIVPGYSKRPIEIKDRGGSIRGNKLDLYFDTHKKAKNWGVKTLHVQIVPA